MWRKQRGEGLRSDVNSYIYDAVSILYILLLLWLLHEYSIFFQWTSNTPQNGTKNSVDIFFLIKDLIYVFEAILRSFLSHFSLLPIEIHRYECAYKRENLGVLMATHLRGRGSERQHPDSWQSFLSALLLPWIFPPFRCTNSLMGSVRILRGKRIGKFYKKNIVYN